MLRTSNTRTNTLVRQSKLLVSLLVSGVFLMFSYTAGAEQGQSEAGAKQHDHQAKKRPHWKPVRESMRQHLKMVDNNGDGKVDLNEYLSNAEARFNEMDLDGDQFVTPEEAKQAHKKLRAKHRELRKERRKHHRRLHQEEQDEDKQLSDQD